MSDFKLTMITINRNNAKGLRKTIESVLSQKNLNPENFEYIIVDGASTDESVEIIKEFDARTDFPLKITSWTSECDTGIYNALNKGIKKATGTLIGIINSGDFLCEDVLAKIFQLHTKMPDTILYGAESRYKDGEFTVVLGLNHKNLTTCNIPHQASFVPLSIYKKYGFYDESFKILSDWNTFLGFYLENVKFYFMNIIVCCFDMDGISSTNLDRCKIESDEIKKRHGLYIDLPKTPKRRKFSLKKIPHYIHKLFWET